MSSVKDVTTSTTNCANELEGLDHNEPSEAVKDYWLMFSSFYRFNNMSLH